MAERILYLVCDVSGSMSEGGKRMLMRGLVRTIEQYIRFRYGAAILKLVIWRDVATLVEWGFDDEVPDEVLNCHGSANVVSLRNLIESQPKGQVLLLTDGALSVEESRNLCRWNRALPTNALRLIRIGCEENPLLRGVTVFESEQVFEALDDWMPRAQNGNKEEDEW